MVFKVQPALAGGILRPLTVAYTYCIHDLNGLECLTAEQGAPGHVVD